MDGVVCFEEVLMLTLLLGLSGPCQGLAPCHLTSFVTLLPKGLSGVVVIVDVVVVTHSAYN